MSWYAPRIKLNYKLAECGWKVEKCDCENCTNTRAATESARKKNGKRKLVTETVSDVEVKNLCGKYFECNIRIDQCEQIIRFVSGCVQKRTA